MYRYVPLGRWIPHRATPGIFALVAESTLGPVRWKSAPFAFTVTNMEYQPLRKLVTVRPPESVKVTWPPVALTVARSLLLGAGASAVFEVAACVDAPDTPLPHPPAARATAAPPIAKIAWLVVV